MPPHSFVVDVLLERNKSVLISRKTFCKALALALVCAILLPCLSLSCTRVSGPPVVSDTPGGISFAELGWDDDRMVYGNSAPATVSIDLPEETKQGDPLWYGIRLDFEISGSPGHAGDDAYLTGTWNDRAMYFMPLESTDTFASGFEWVTHESLSGWHMGYEVSDEFPAASTSFAILDAVKGGTNTVSIRLDAEEDIQNLQVKIKKESQLVAVRWKKTDIVGSGYADIDGDTVTVQFQAENVGETADDLRITVIVYRDDTSVKYQTSHIGVLAKGDSLNFSDTILLVPGAPVFSVDVDVEWNGGREYLRLWPESPLPPWYERVPRAFRSTAGALVAIVVLWLGIPALTRRIRNTDGQDYDDSSSTTAHGPGWLHRLGERFRLRRTSAVGLFALGLCISGMAAALLWFTPWQGTEDSWQPLYTTLPLSSPDEDRETLNRVMAAFLNTNGLVQEEGPPEVGHIKVISQKGKRIGVYAEARLKQEVWIDGPLALMRCGEPHTWEGEGFWLEGARVWIMDKDEAAYLVELKDYHEDDHEEEHENAEDHAEPCFGSTIRSHAN